MLRDRVQQGRIIGHWSRDNSHRPPVKKFPRSIVEKFAVLTVAFPGDCRAVALHGEKEERSRGRYEKRTFQGKTHIYYFVPLENFYYAYRLIFPIDLIELYKPLLMELTTQLSVSVLA